MADNDIIRYKKRSEYILERVACCAPGVLRGQSSLIYVFALDYFSFSDFLILVEIRTAAYDGHANLKVVLHDGYKLNCSVGCKRRRMVKGTVETSISYQNPGSGGVP